MRSSTTSRLWQKIVGQPSLPMSGRANSANVSDRRITCVRARSESRNSTAPSSGDSPAMTSAIALIVKPVLGQQIQPVAHQHVVVGLVARRAAQRLDARALGDGDPDLGQQHALDVERDERRPTIRQRTHPVPSMARHAIPWRSEPADAGGDAHPDRHRAGDPDRL